jgi:8-oxo-dGTP diphosphatase
MSRSVGNEEGGAADEQLPERSHRNVTAVGGIVLRGESVLLVRMAYGPARGRYMFPGGTVDPDETLDQAVAREVFEETGVTARPQGIVGVRTRHDAGRTDTYVMFLMEHQFGEPRAHGRENDDARFFRLSELEAAGDAVTDLSRYVALRALRGDLRLLGYAADLDHAAAGRDPEAWKLFC